MIISMQNWGDRLASKQQLDIDYLAKVDAALALADAVEKDESRD